VVVVARQRAMNTTSDGEYYLILLLLIYFPTTQLFPWTMVFKNLHAHTKKAIAGGGGALGGAPVTRISMCTYSTRCGPQTPHLNFTPKPNHFQFPMDFGCMQLFKWTERCYAHSLYTILVPFLFPNYHPTVLEKNLFIKWKK